jgi:hypothetical protein
MKNKLYDVKRATTQISNNAAKRLIPLGMCEFWDAELSNSGAREVNRAHVLSCLDRDIPEAQIMTVLGIGRTAVWRARAAYLQGGVELAVFDVERSGRPRQYDTNAEAHVTALACSAPPAGRQRWTMVELERCSPRARHAIREP